MDLFATFLAGSVQHSSIKVYLSAVRALHIEEGFPDPLVDCLRLQRVLRGIKRTQGSPEAQRLPITDHILMIIFGSLDLAVYDHCMFWAACNLAYFGFLRSAEFTVPNLACFSPTLHLGVCDISVDSDISPSCLRVRIKASKTDPFRKGCFVHIGKGRFPLCALQPFWPTWHGGEMRAALFFFSRMVGLSPALSSRLVSEKSSQEQVFQEISPVTVFALVRPPLQLVAASLIILFRPWAVGLVLRTSRTFALLPSPWLHSRLISLLARLGPDPCLGRSPSNCRSPEDHSQVVLVVTVHLAVPLRSGVARNSRG